MVDTKHPEKGGRWQGEHWVDRNGYCKAEDGPCENPRPKRAKGIVIGVAREEE